MGPYRGRRRDLRRWLAAAIATACTAGVLSLGLRAQDVLEGSSLPPARPSVPLPPPKQTVAAWEAKVRADALRKPQPPKHPERYPLIPTPGPSPTPRKALPETPAGAGVIVESGLAPFPAAMYRFENTWYEVTGNATITVWAGAERSDPAQGVVVVAVSTLDHKPAGGGSYPTPVKAGAVRVVGAQGERLDLVSEAGTRFTFDVAARGFLSP